MSRHIKYIRVSTEQQGFEQQELTINNYLKGIKYDELIEVQEKVSGTIDYNDRKLKSVLDLAETGDVIVVSELSRIARSMTNLFEFVGKCQDKGVTVVQAKDNTIIPSDRNNIVAKALLFAFGLSAEIEVMNIRQRTQAGMDARRELKKRDGGWINNKGEWATGFGRKKGCDTSHGAEAAAVAHRMKKENDPAWKKAKAYATRRFNEGMSMANICSEMNKDGLLTRRGNAWSVVAVRNLLND